jgi:hypothetical protein
VSISLQMENKSRDNKWRKLKPSLDTLSPSFIGQLNGTMCRSFHFIVSFTLVYGLLACWSWVSGFYFLFVVVHLCVMIYPIFLKPAVIMTIKNVRNPNENSNWICFFKISGAKHCIIRYIGDMSNHLTHYTLVLLLILV